MLHGLGFLAYTVTETFTWFCVVTLLLMTLETTTTSLQQTLVGAIFSEDTRVRAMSRISAGRNAALGAGTLLAGLALSTESKPLLVSACVVGGWTGHLQLPRAAVLVGCVLVVLLLTIGENLHSLAGWQVSFDLSPEDRRGEYTAAFNMSYGLQRAIGPVLTVGLVLGHGVPGWLALSLVFAAGCAGFLVFSRTDPNAPAM